MAGSSVSGGGGGGHPSLFATEKPKRVLAYRLYAGTIFAGILLIWFYRATHIPARGSSSLGWRAGLGLLVAELWFGLYWVLTLSVRWNPVRRTTFKDRLSASYDDDQLPAVDIFVCTADPDLEPPMLVISTVLSVMAYDYPPEKLNIYLSDDAGSAITFYALHEASEFAKHWIPFCKNYKVEPRSPAAYFAQGDTPHDACSPQELLRMKELYKDLTDHVNSVVHSGKIPEVPECNRRGFSEWNETITPGDHPSIVQILIDRNKRKAVDVDGNALPKLVYMAREKRPQEQHHFKAGSLNALIRISSVISNSPVILNVDCDMYSNNSESVRDALCFFLDEEQGQDIGFVQYPQNFDNVVHNDIYGNPINVVNELDNPCLDGWGGMCYYGTGCFHRREALSGQIYSKDYKEDWAKGVGIAENADELEETSKSLVTCTYEHNTPWGIEKGVRYGCPLEDVITGLQIQCRGWRSVYYNPSRKGFLGKAPTSLGQILVQHKRWSPQRLRSEAHHTTPPPASPLHRPRPRPALTLANLLLEAPGGGRSGAMGLFDRLPPMDHLRSEKMCLVQLIFPAESARLAVTYLGELGLLQFKDLNEDKSPFQRIFVNQVKRCAEMSRKLKFFSDQINKAGVKSSVRPALQPEIDLEELEAKLGEHEHELLEMNTNSGTLRQTYNELLEFKLVLSKAGSILAASQNHATPADHELDEHIYDKEVDDGNGYLLEQGIHQGALESGVRFVSGIILKSKALAFERMLFRTTRGNMFFNQASAGEPVMDPSSGEEVEKTVFVVFFSGEQAKAKILRICASFGANCYPVPEEIVKQRQIFREVSSRLSDLEVTLDAGIQHRNKALESVGSQLWRWILMVKKEKAVYDTLNMLNFDVTKKCLVGEGWCPIFAKSQIEDVLQRATLHSNSQVGIIFHEMDTIDSPPTYFRTDKFTNAFQEIVDAYGVGRYEEINPAVYSVITFPFLFAVMFGDWGHGICLLIGALILILREKKLSSQKLDSFTEMAFGGRYVILLMALFSIYCGLIYNEFFSVPFHIFGKSAYACRENSCSDAYTAGLVKVRDPYPFGVDPSWRGSRSELPFLNSLKMKMSILMGVSQMNLGILLSYFDAKFHKNALDIRYQFIPQLIFLNSLFGYLSLLILIKWCTGSKADLYHVMIYMFLDPAGDLGENQLFWGQKELQILLLLLALVAVPWMLFPKPFILKKLHKERFQGHSYRFLGTSDMDPDSEPDSARSRHDDFNFGEVFVHQMIHSIEFVLGAVSNTASYLRLWALSLAHSELSTVFYEKLLLFAWGYDSLIFKLVGLIVFAFATAFILLGMESLSAFLHALRLHWVEFMNKFYHGDGYKFKPFSFALLAEDEE